MISENLAEIYQKSFKDNWDLPAMSDFSTGNTILYKDFVLEIAKLHFFFEKLGIKKGDKIALTGRNNTEWCIIYIASLTYGSVIVPILQDFNIENIQHIITHSDAEYLFLDKNIWGKINKNDIPLIKKAFSTESGDFVCFYDKDNITVGQSIDDNIGKEFNEHFPNGYKKEDVKYSNVCNDDIAVLNYTSGTTGYSKGVMLTANNLAGNIVYAQYLELLYRGENILSFLPLAHAYGCAFEFLYALSIGGHITLLGKPPVSKILLDAFAKVKPRLILTVPLILEKMYRNSILPKLEDPKVKMFLKIPLLRNIIYKKIRNSLIDAMGGEVREIIVGGAALNNEVERFFHKIKMPITVGYGMTECAPLISYDHYYDFVPSSCGRILENIMEVRIDSEDPYKISGEIQVRGENVMRGYYKNEKATEEVFTEDGWLKTGDLGTIDKENRIYIRGRSKTMLLGPSGQNIYPEEIEAKINLLPYVIESIVVQRKNRLIALIYLDQDLLKNDVIDESRLKEILENSRNKLNKELNSYEKITCFQIVKEEFEKTPKKSIKRFLYT